MKQCSIRFVLILGVFGKKIPINLDENDQQKFSTSDFVQTFSHGSLYTCVISHKLAIQSGVSDQNKSAINWSAQNDHRRRGDFDRLNGFSQLEFFAQGMSHSTTVDRQILPRKDRISGGRDDT